MKKYIILIISFLFLFSIQSCEKKNKKSVSNVIVTDSLSQNSPEESCGEETEEQNLPDEADAVYPETGKKTSDFLPKIGIYEIQYEAKGDLNNDGLADAVIVLKHIENNTAKRPMLVLLQNADKSYRLDKMSKNVMPAEYNEYDFKYYNPEDIKIEKGKLHIYLFGSMHDMISCFFKYDGKDLILTYMTSYTGGAGSRTEITDDYEKGESTITEIDTSIKDNPGISQTSKITSEPYLFENVSIFDLHNGEDSSS